MRTNNKAINPGKHPHILKESDGTPERSLATPGELGNLRLFGVDIPVVGPQPEESEYHFPLAGSQPQGASQAVPDLIKLPEEKPW